MDWLTLKRRTIEKVFGHLASRPYSWVKGEAPVKDLGGGVLKRCKQNQFAKGQLNSLSSIP